MCPFPWFSAADAHSMRARTSWTPDASDRAELEELPGGYETPHNRSAAADGRELHDPSANAGLPHDQNDPLLPNGHAPWAGRPPRELLPSAAEITNDIHSLSHRLHSSALDYLGLVPALQKLISEFSTRHGIAVDFQAGSLPASLPSDVALCLFRVIEESLTNIVKHSQATSARVALNAGVAGLHLIVEDSGRGFDPESLARKAGLGFVSMRERLRVLHGTVRVDSAPDRGTRISVWVPPASVVPPPALVPPRKRASSSVNPA